MTNPKTILVPFNGEENELATLDVVFSLAQRFQAHVEVWHIAPDPFVAMTSYPSFAMSPIYPEAAIQMLEKRNKESADKARQQYVRIAERHELTNTEPGNPAIKDPSCSFHAVTGNTEDIISTRGLVVDLIVMGRPEGESKRAFVEMVTAIVSRSGRPFLLIPSGTAALRLENDALIAWNGSLEAGRAVFFSLPFLRGKAWIVSRAEDDEETAPSSEELAAFLWRHGIQSETVNASAEDSSATNAIVNAAKSTQAEIIVMGVYGHNRLKENVLGGVTDFMLHHADNPLLLAR